MSIQEVKNSWIYLDSNSQNWKGDVSAAQGVYQPIHWVALGRMQAELRLAPYEGRIVDMGCGHGVVTINLAWKRPRTQVIGLDPDENRLAIGRQMLAEHHFKNCEFRKGSIDEPGVESGSCAGVICTEVLDHLPDARNVLKEKVEKLLDLLCPGGRLILSVLDELSPAESRIRPPSPLKISDFDFLPKLTIDRNCPRWWHLFYFDKK